MPLALTWPEIALRLALAAVASFLIGLNRDERGHPAGIRTTMLVCLAAAFAMVQVNLLLPLAGRPQGSFNQLDLMRLPLGILSGIGFIGAGVIVKNDRSVTGVTTAATLWYVTVMGLLFGGGQLRLGGAAFAIGMLILWGLRHLENHIPRGREATLHLEFADGAPVEAELHRMLQQAGCRIARWNPTFDPPDRLRRLDCELRWTSLERDPAPAAGQRFAELQRLPGLSLLSWNE